MAKKKSKPESPLRRLLVIDDEESVLAAIEGILENANYSVSTCSNASDALALLEKESFQLVLCDLKMPKVDGLEFIDKAKASGVSSTIIMMSAYGSIDIALEAIKRGAYDYISKPFNADEILLTIKKAEERELLRLENEQLKAAVSHRFNFANIIAKSESMQSIFQTIEKISDYRTTVMIYGESGTGKELIARAIHFNSPRKRKKFVAINCGAIPENLLESELFGHMRGAFTDATRDKKGLFEEAEGGTILLDEVGELPTHLQVKLLRVLQENEIRPVGSSEVKPIDVRVITATLRDLELDVNDGRFRDDLYYRLNVISLRIPALRERKEDIPILVDYFLEKNREQLGLKIKGVSGEALAKLVEYDWPGNIRELENCVERAMILAEGDEIDVSSLPKSLFQTSGPAPMLTVPEGELSIKIHTKTLEEQLIRKALEETSGNRTHAAKLLEISHRTLLYKLKEYNLT